MHSILVNHTIWAYTQRPEQKFRVWAISRACRIKLNLSALILFRLSHFTFFCGLCSHSVHTSWFDWRVHWIFFTRYWVDLSCIGLASVVAIRGVRNDKNKSSRQIVIYSSSIVYSVSSNYRALLFFGSFFSNWNRRARPSLLGKPQPHFLLPQSCCRVVISLVRDWLRNMFGFILLHLPWRALPPDAISCYLSKINISAS